MKIATLHANLPPTAGPSSLVTALGQNRFICGGLAFALVAAGLAWQWNWLVTIGVAPLLLSAAPCVAMCGLGLCMHRMGGRICASASDTSTIHTIPQSSSIGEEK
jgi:hypothetical protein